MVILVLGLIIFLIPHSIRIFAETTRNQMLARRGEPIYKGVYSLVSLLGLILIGMGYGDAKAEGAQVYDPISGLSHLALILVPVSFILVVASYVPTGRIKAWVRHPMVLGIALWSLGHLLANGALADVALFGAFLVWAIVDYAASVRRTGPIVASGQTLSLRGDGLAVIIGLAGAAAFILGLHQWLFGVAPIG